MNNKKKLIFLGLDVLVLIVTIGVSLAVFNYVKKGESSNKVTIGGITMNFTEGERNISIPVATPASDEEGKVFGLDNIENQKCTNDSENNVQCYTDFTISTNMNIDYSISYEVTLDKDETSTLSNSDVRIYLEKQDENGEYKEVFTPKEYTPIDSENPTETDELGATNSEMLIDSGEITKSVTYYYRLRMWVKGDYKITEAIKDFSAKINVYGSNVEVNASTGINLTLDGDKINDKTITLQKGEQNKKVIAEVLPDNTKNKNLIWESSDTSKVKIDSAGNLSLDNIGTSIIIVSTSDRSKSATFTINVVNPSVSSIELPETLTLSKGNHETLTPTITPSDAVYDSITWSSSSEGIATVTNGYIEAVGIGETDITAETNGKTSTCHVIVTVPNVSEIVIDGIDTVDAGKTIKLTATTESDSLAESNIIWTSSDETLATVSSTGTVAGIAKGTVTITAYIKEHPDIKATKEITVRNILSKELTFSGNQTVNVGATPSFVATITPSDARDVEYIKWSSSDSSIASIPESCNTNHTTTCNIETLKKGTATITVETKDKKDGETYRSATATLTINELNLNDKIASLLTTPVNEDGGITRKSADGTIIETRNNVTWPSSETHINYRYTYNEDNAVNNYVWFNCDKDVEPSETTCERWRIVGSFSDIYSTGNANGPSGTPERRVKIMRAESIGTYSWDTGTENNGWGTNDWTGEVLSNEYGGDLMKLLNPGYESRKAPNNIGTLVKVNNSLYWNRLSDGTCYIGQTNLTENCNFSKKGLKSESESITKSIIGNAYWNLGGYATFDVKMNSDNFLKNTLYAAERGNISGGSNGKFYWIGKIALVYPSDYAYAGWNCNKDYMFSKDATSDLRICNTKNWMYFGDDEWLLSPANNSVGRAWFVYAGGHVNSGFAGYRLAVRPTTYLKSNVVVKQDGADGSYDKPYNIQLGT